MNILAIRTDKPEAELYVYRNKVQIASRCWLAHKELAETLHTTIVDVLREAEMTLVDIDAVICYDTGGSFTGLRIGAAVANALASSIGCLVTGSHGDNWVNDGIDHVMKKGGQEGVVNPNYGAPANVTPPKK